MREHSIRSSVALASIAVLSLVRASAAQCPNWSPIFDGVVFNGFTRCFAPFDDGTGPALYMGGTFNNAIGPEFANRIVRWNGSAWSTLGSGIGGFPSSSLVVSAMTAFDDGTGPALYVGGDFGQAGTVFARAFAKWNGMWSQVGGGVSAPNGTVTRIDTLVVFDDGSGPSLYVGGSFTGAGGMPIRNIARWNSAGWSSLGDADAEVSSLAVGDDGTGPALFAGGTFTTIGGVSAQHIAKWQGGVWSPLGSGTSGYVNAMRSFDDGTGTALYLAGQFNSIGGVSATSLARWNGTTWSALPGVAGGAMMQTFAEYDDGQGNGTELYAGGTTSGFQNGVFVKWTGSTWTPVGGAVVNNIMTLSVFDSGSGPRLFVGGLFSHTDGQPANNVATWDGTNWSSVSPMHGITGTINTLLPFDDGTNQGTQLFVGGSISVAGATPVTNLARWDGANWHATGSALMPGTVQALARFNAGNGEQLYIAGTFLRALAWWNGTSITLNLPGLNGPAYALVGHDDGSGNALYVGGAFDGVYSGIALHSIGRWNGTAWSDVGGGVTGTIYSMVEFDDGSGTELVIGGSFTTAGGAPARIVARWNGTSWAPFGSGPGFGTNSVVTALIVFDDRGGSGTALYAGGQFAGTVSNVARWNGTDWIPVGTLTNTVDALTAYNDGSGPALYAAAAWAGAPGSVARWNGTAWSAVGGGVGFNTNQSANALVAHDDGSGPALYVGGAFTNAGAFSSLNIAKWQGCAGTGTPFCAGDGSNPNLIACPCANFGISGHGCDNSAATGGALLSASGVPFPDTIVLHANGELASVLSIFLQGDATIANGTRFGDGVRCVGGHLKRLFAKNASAGGVDYPTFGEPAISDRSAALGDPIPSGASRYYQVYYRDPQLAFCAAPAGDSWNVSSGIIVVW
jgi:hypothetical protein